jgi:hypothetical protein
MPAHLLQEQRLRRGMIIETTDVRQLAATKPFSNWTRSGVAGHEKTHH